MPTYEYRCPKCGVFERHQRFSDPNLETCPTCLAPVTKLISKNVGIVFKGSGFYITDSRKSSGEDSGGSQSKPEAAASGE
ncbi:MAG: FmdB family zinc ribbon protein [Bacillota bacterium]